MSEDASRSFCPRSACSTQQYTARGISTETQRLGIARALVLDPEILFLDEPTASIDEENTRIIESIIKDMGKEGRAMVILTTHDNAQAERIADRILILDHGVFQG